MEEEIYWESFSEAWYAKDFTVAGEVLAMAVRLNLSLQGREAPPAAQEPHLSGEVALLLKEGASQGLEIWHESTFYVIVTRLADLLVKGGGLTVRALMN